MQPGSRRMGPAALRAIASRLLPKPGRLSGLSGLSQVRNYRREALQHQITIQTVFGSVQKVRLVLNCSQGGATRSR